MKYYVIIKEDGRLFLGESDGSYESLKSLVGGEVKGICAQYMPIREKTIMFICENANNKGINMLATELHGDPDRRIYGDAVIALIPEFCENEQAIPYDDDTAIIVMEVLKTIQWAIKTNCWNTLRSLLPVRDKVKEEI